MMKKTIMSLPALCALMLLSVPAQAEYYGLKMGDMRIEGLDNVNGTPRMYGLVIGKQKGQGQSVEIEYNKMDSMKDALPTDADYTIETYALYSVARTQETTYFKSKIGYLYEKTVTDTFDATDKGFTLGLGLGYRLGGTSMIEMEYTWISSDLKLVSLSYIF